MYGLCITTRPLGRTLNTLYPSALNLIPRSRPRMLRPENGMSAITTAMVLADVFVLVGQLLEDFQPLADRVLILNHTGIHLAERNLFIGVAKLLWAFDFRVKGGETMNTSAETGLSQGFLHCVKDYGSSITLRSKARGDTILREFEEAQTIFAKFE